MKKASLWGLQQSLLLCWLWEWHKVVLCVPNGATIPEHQEGTESCCWAVVAPAKPFGDCIPIRGLWISEEVWQYHCHAATWGDVLCQVLRSSIFLTDNSNIVHITCNNALIAENELFKKAAMRIAHSVPVSDEQEALVVPSGYKFKHSTWTNKISKSTWTNWGTSNYYLFVHEYWW